MLVLTRKLYESICIGDHSITVTVVGITPTQVKLGIEAPANVRVNRREVELRHDHFGDATKEVEDE